MKPAPLQLFDYKVLKMHFEANQDFDSSKPATLCFDSIEVKPKVCLIPSEDPSLGSVWKVNLHVIQSNPEGKNIPYSFELEIVGQIFANPSLQEDNLEQVVSANAPAILFGVAREVVRSATSLGPYAAVILPSTNFIQEPQKKVGAKKAGKKTAPKKKVARKSSKKVAKKSTK